MDPAPVAATRTCVYVSDSEYLVKGMTEWLPGWQARGWRRKTGSLENLELWQALAQVAAHHTVDWRWVRGATTSTSRTSTPTACAIRAAEEQRAFQRPDRRPAFDYLARAAARSRQVRGLRS